MSDTITDAEIEKARRNHNNRGRCYPKRRCFTCREAYPCLLIRLLDENERLETTARRLGIALAEAVAPAAGGGA